MFGAHHREGPSNSMCEYKAGKLVLRRENGRQMMVADKRKGIIKVLRDESDGLVHFQWLERRGGVMGQPTRTHLEDDLILFPKEAVMKKSGQGGSGRIYLLKFRQGDRKLYFWFQEDEGEGEGGDEEFVTKVNLSLNGTTSEDLEDEAKAQGSGSGGDEKDRGDKAAPSTTKDNEDGDAGGAGDEEKKDDAKDGDAAAGGEDAVPMDTQQEGGEADLVTHPLADSDHAVGGDGVSQETLAAALLAAASAVHGGAAPSGPSLAQVLKPETIVPLLRNKDIQERLAEFLPEEHRHEAAILELAASAQFQQQLETFSQALQSGQLNLNAFGIPHNALTVADFLRSIETISQEAKEQRPKGEEAEKKESTQ